MTGRAIGEVVPFGVAVAVSPLPVIAIVLILATPRGRVNGPAFVAGAVAGVSVVGALVLLAANRGDPRDAGAPAAWVSVAKLALGTLLLAYALQQWRARPRSGVPPELPGWTRTIDGFTPARSAAVGVGLAALNPKNLILVVGAAMAIAETGASTGGQAVALAVFVVLGSLGVVVPTALSLVAGERAAAFLLGLRDWMARESSTIVAVVALLLGAKLIGDAIAGFAA